MREITDNIQSSNSTRALLRVQFRPPVDRLSQLPAEPLMLAIHQHVRRPSRGGCTQMSRWNTGMGPFETH